MFMESSIIINCLKEVLDLTSPSDALLNCDSNSPFFEHSCNLVSARLIVSELISAIKLTDKYSFNNFEK